MKKRFMLFLLYVHIVLIFFIIPLFISFDGVLNDYIAAAPFIIIFVFNFFYFPISLKDFSKERNSKKTYSKLYGEEKEKRWAAEDELAKCQKLLEEYRELSSDVPKGKFANIKKANETIILKDIQEHLYPVTMSEIDENNTIINEYSYYASIQTATISIVSQDKNNRLTTNDFYAHHLFYTFIRKKDKVPLTNGFIRFLQSDVEKGKDYIVKNHIDFNSSNEVVSSKGKRYILTFQKTEPVVPV